MSGMRFVELMERICDKALRISTTVNNNPELVGDDGDLNDWAGDVLNELHDMLILLAERERGHG